jgi:dienelactone hydrolase
VIRTGTLLLALLCAPLFKAQAAEEIPRQLITDYWLAESEQQQQQLGEALKERAGDAATLYRWFGLGPEFSASVATGIVEKERLSAEGISYPYVILVPESYDASRAYPVDFMLHGGVGRPKPAAGDSYWRSGYESLQTEDRLVVVPVAWNEAFWWHERQAENLTEILREVRRLYNVDDNRVSLTGVSDGGTGAWFFAFKQPTEWAAFFAYIGHPGVLRSPQSGGGYRLYFENLMGKAIYIVNGEEDPLYPAASLASFIEILEQEDVNHQFRVIEGGGHNTQWLAEEQPAIEAFKSANPREPFPAEVQWVSDSAERFNRNHWIRIDELQEEGRPSLLRVSQDDNVFNVTAYGVEQFTLLLSPRQVNLSDPVMVSVNGRIVFTGSARPDMDVVLQSAKERDRALLYSSELQIDVAN